MSVHPRVRRSIPVQTCVVQAALPLGHADVHWDALPRAVQVDVLARWCEMLRDVMAPATDGEIVADESGS